MGYEDHSEYWPLRDLTGQLHHGRKVNCGSLSLFVRVIMTAGDVSVSDKCLHYD